MPRKKPASGRKKKPTPKPAAPPTKAALRFWVPPSVRATDGGVVSGRKKPPAKPKPKFWTPEQLGFTERPKPDAEWETQWDKDVEGISYSRVTTERVDGVDIQCVWYGRETIGGLAAIGLPGHETRCMAFLHGVATDYQPSAGYCVDHGCSTNDKYTPVCEGARWVLRYLERRADVAKVLDTELARINNVGNTGKTNGESSGGEGNRRQNIARNAGRNVGRNAGHSGGRNDS